MPAENVILPRTLIALLPCTFVNTLCQKKKANVSELPRFCGNASASTNAEIVPAQQRVNQFWQYRKYEKQLMKSEIIIF
jgi:hypothetical protein